MGSIRELDLNEAEGKDKFAAWSILVVRGYYQDTCARAIIAGKLSHTLTLRDHVLGSACLAGRGICF
jgi:hypothetical protein